MVAAKRDCECIDVDVAGCGGRGDVDCEVVLWEDGRRGEGCEWAGYVWRGVMADVDNWKSDLRRSRNITFLYDDVDRDGLCK